MESLCGKDTDRLYTLAASDGKRLAILFANLTGSAQPICISGVDLEDARFYVLGEAGTLAWAPNADVIENNTVVLIETDR